MPARTPARRPTRRRSSSSTPYVRRRLLALGALLVVVALVVVAALGVRGWLRDRGVVVAPLPGEERCVATVNDRDVVLDLDQAHYTSIVVGLSVRRGLAPRAGSIAMATVYQETGIRNLDYGDRDSVGLFQQRPSQGWGSEKQLMDPYYATTKFYNALVRVKDWESRDITKVAQAVQRSAYPDAYRDHEPDARVLASALTGETDAPSPAWSRRRGRRRRRAGGVAGGDVPGGREGHGQGRDHDREEPAAGVGYAQYAVANAGRHGVVSVEVDDRTWTSDAFALPTWVKKGNAGRRSASPSADLLTGKVVTRRRPTASPSPERPLPGGRARQTEEARRVTAASTRSSVAVRAKRTNGCAAAP